MKLLKSLTLVVVGLLMMVSCEGNETKISSFNGKDSHYTGDNCMNCHKSGGEGEGWFTAAGTVYKENKTAVYPNTTIELYKEANGKGLVSTIEVDGLGNFYTTKSIDFGTGLYPAVKGDGGTKYMSTTISVGTCNSCHGVTTDKMWAK